MRTSEPCIVKYLCYQWSTTLAGCLCAPLPCSRSLLQSALLRGKLVFTPLFYTRSLGGTRYDAKFLLAGNTITLALTFLRALVTFSRTGRMPMAGLGLLVTVLLITRSPTASSPAAG